MACTFLGSILYPAGVRCPPKNVQSWDLNTNLFALKVRLLALAVSSRVMTAASWVVSSLPWQRISSTIPALLGTFLNTLSILSWKTSPATFSPKGRHSHQYLPQGVLKVVRKLLSLSRGTCQYPDFASSKLKYFESASSSRMSSTVLLYH